MENPCLPVQDGIYTRTIHPYRSELEETLNTCYTTGGLVPKSFIFSSGTNAIYSLLQCILSRSTESTVVVCDDELYSDSRKILKFFPNIRLIAIDFSEEEQVTSVFLTQGTNIRIAYFESCSNPSGKMINWKHLKANVKKYAKGCQIICDNTWLSSALFNPFKFGAHYVVLSLTKYYSGGNCILGAVLGTKKGMKAAIKFGQISGVYVDPRACRLTNTMIATINDRVLNAGRLALQVSLWLESSGLVTKVMYPMLNSHPCRMNVKLTSGPGCLLFHVPVYKPDFPQWTWTTKWVNQIAEVNRIADVNGIESVKQAQSLKYETSYGNEYSKIDPWPKKGLVGDVMGTWIRLSIGYKSQYEDIIHDLQLLLTNLPILDK